MFFKKLFSKKEAVNPKSPAGSVVYAVGDIHGRLDLLQKIQDEILADAARSKAARKVVIYLGDYVDRGKESKGVIEHLINYPLYGFESIFLKGNHEHAMQNFLDDPKLSEIWLFWGGEATLYSYGVDIRDEKGRRPDVDRMGQDFANKFPEKHREFLKKLRMKHIEGDYIFVHAGLRPGISIENQTEEDMMMIREEFIFSKDLFEKTVIFGHTIFSEPFVKRGRIGIDTGSYASGNLTCVALEGEDVRFITVNSN